MQFSGLSKLRFYFSLAFYNLLSPLECRNPRFRFLINEFYYLYLVINRKNFASDFTKKLLLKTKFDDFRIRDICWDVKVTSPAFERLDIEELIRRISDSLVQNRRVIFIDIGAQFGKYTVTIGNRFRKDSKNMAIYAFEPDPENFSLLEENIRINRLHNVTLFRKALSNKSATQKFYYYPPQKMIVSFPTSRKITIKTEMLDNYVSHFPHVDKSDIFIKLDVEGHEIKVLQGSKRLIQKARNTTLLVEDVKTQHSLGLLPYLAHRGIKLTKKTVYNSFWRLDKHSRIS